MNMRATLNRSWQQIAGRYAALARRQRGWILIVVMLGAVLSGYIGLLEPELKRHVLFSKQIAQQRADLAALQAQTQTLGAQRKDPNAATREQIAEARRQLHAVDAQFERLQNSLVPPQEMNALVEQLIKRHGGLQLRTLRTLPVIPVNEILTKTSEPSAARSEKSESSPQAQIVPGQKSWLYRHGVEITVQGGYADMLAYLDELEHLPRRVYWGELKLDAQSYPVSVMTVVVYTISLEKAWLTL